MQPNPESNPYTEQQILYWQNLKRQLEKYRKEYDASVTELAKGLDVSRQRLYDFMKSPEEGLGFTWASLMNLWLKLSQPEEDIWNKLKPKYQAKRDELREEGPDSLLASVGFAPNNSQASDVSQFSANDSQIPTIKTLNPQVWRAFSRLNSNWVLDDVTRTYLASEIIDLILTKGRTILTLEEKLHEREVIENWPKGKPLKSDDDISIGNYQEEVTKLMNFGKSEFTQTELYEIYQSIYEHQILNEHIPNHINIIKLEFQNLSIPIENFDTKTRDLLVRENLLMEEDIDLFDKETSDKFIQAEGDLLAYLSGNLDHNKTSQIDDRKATTSKLNSIDISANSVIEVAITCNLSYGNHNHPDVIWRYSSSASHLQNMFSALINGLGYPFDIINFSIRQIGSLKRSIVRSEIVLGDPDQEDKIYQGWWVGYNTFIGFLRATVDAVKRWLNDQKVNHIVISRYYESFQKLAEIDEQLLISRASFYSHQPEFISRIADDCHKTIQDVIDKFTEAEKKDRYFLMHEILLTKKAKTALLNQMHIYLLEGDLRKANAFLQEAEYMASKAEDGILTLNASSCLMFYKLLVGERDFLKTRLWRTKAILSIDFSLAYHADKLGEYIKKQCCIDIDAYLYASQFWGTIGYLEFYTASSSEDREDLTKAISNFLAAAQYACRIGHMKRAIHWLAYTSRAYCRLGDLKRAHYYAELSKIASNRSLYLNNLGDGDVVSFTNFSAFFKPLITNSNTSSIEKMSDSDRWIESGADYQNWSMNNLYLAKGEIEYFEKNYEKAIDFFIRSLNISVYTGFSRLAADSLFNISRAAKNLPKSSEKFYILSEKSEQIWARNSVTQGLYKHLCSLGEQKNSSYKISWGSKCDDLKAHSVKIWNEWANWNKSGEENFNKHPFGEAIEDDSFLAKIE